MEAQILLSLSKPAQTRSKSSKAQNPMVLGFGLSGLSWGSAQTRAAPWSSGRMTLEPGLSTRHPAWHLTFAPLGDSLEGRDWNPLIVHPA